MTTSWLIVAGLVAWWLWDSYKRPWRPCGWCKGNPKNWRRGAFNVFCFWCKGSGRRRRWGARILRRGFGQL